MAYYEDDRDREAENDLYDGWDDEAEWDREHFGDLPDSADNYDEDGDNGTICLYLTSEGTQLLRTVKAIQDEKEAKRKAAGKDTHEYSFVPVHATDLLEHGYSLFTLESTLHDFDYGESDCRYCPVDASLFYIKPDEPEYSIEELISFCYQNNIEKITDLSWEGIEKFQFPNEDIKEEFFDRLDDVDIRFELSVECQYYGMHEELEAIRYSLADLYDDFGTTVNLPEDIGEVYITLKLEN